MLDWTQLAIAWALTLFLTLVVAAILRRPLFAVLQFICGTDVGARFWTAYSTVMMVVGPFFLVSFGSGDMTSPVDYVRRVMVLISVGLIGTVIIMGIAVQSATKRKLPEAPLPTPVPGE
jgi:hypothetical protein